MDTRASESSSGQASTKQLAPNNKPQPNQTALKSRITQLNKEVKSRKEDYDRLNQALFKRDPNFAQDRAESEKKIQQLNHQINALEGQVASLTEELAEAKTPSRTTSDASTQCDPVSLPPSSDTSVPPSAPAPAGIKRGREDEDDDEGSGEATADGVGRKKARSDADNAGNDDSHGFEHHVELREARDGKKKEQ